MTTATTGLSSESDKLLVTKAEAARLLSLSPTEIDRLRRAGKLLAKKKGSKVLFPRTELVRFVNDLPWEVDQ